VKRILHPTFARGAFYISGTLFFLSLTLLVGVHIGDQTVEAQKVKTEVAATIPSMTLNQHWIITTAGDVYLVQALQSGTVIGSSILVGNIFQ